MAGAENISSRLAIGDDGNTLYFTSERKRVRKVGFIMMEFAVFFVIPFDESIPKRVSDETIERLKAIKNEIEQKCLDAYHEIIPEEKEFDKRVWAQSRIDFEMRIIGVSLRLPIEKAAEKNVVASVVHDDFLYWDLDELTTEMFAMRDAVAKVAQEYRAKPHTAFSDVRYHY